LTLTESKRIRIQRPWRPVAHAVYLFYRVCKIISPYVKAQKTLGLDSRKSGMVK